MPLTQIVIEDGKHMTKIFHKGVYKRTVPTDRSQIRTSKSQLWTVGRKESTIGIIAPRRSEGFRTTTFIM